MIYTHIYDVDQLTEFLDQQTQHDDRYATKMPIREFFERTMPLYGIKDHNLFIIIENDEADSYNPIAAYSQLMSDFYEDTNMQYALTSAPVKTLTEEISVTDEQLAGVGIVIPVDIDD